jgi:branched-chain amino acid transport system substrate-binding protein
MPGRAIVSVLSLFVLLAACSTGQPAPAAKQGSDVNIGIPLSLSGGSAQEGGLTKQGYDLWLDWANRDGGIVVGGVRHRVHLNYQDDASDPQKSAQVAQQLIADGKAQFLLGPYGTPNTATVAAVADKAHVPVVAPTAAARDIFMQGYRYVFGVLASATEYPKAITDMAVQMNPKPVRVAILAANDLFSQAAAKAAMDYDTAHGQQIVFFQTYPTNLTNFHPLVQQAAATDPDLFADIGHLLDAIAAHKAALDLQLNAKLFVYGVGPNTPEFSQVLGKAGDYSVAPSPWTAEARYKASYYLTTPQYVAAYRKKFHTQQEPSFVVADATASGVALQAAMEHAGSLNPGKVRDALARLDINTFYGRIRFDPQGMNSYRSTLVVQVQNGQQMTVWPPELANAVPEYPTPTWVQRLGVPAAPPKARLPGTGAP